MNNLLKIVLGAGFAVAVAYYVNTSFGHMAHAEFKLSAQSVFW